MSLQGRDFEAEITGEGVQESDLGDRKDRGVLTSPSGMHSSAGGGDPRSGGSTGPAGWHAWPRIQAFGWPAVSVRLTIRQTVVFCPVSNVTSGQPL